MFAQKFFTLFPPPAFLNIPYAGLDISDDAVRCVALSKTSHGMVVHRFGMKPLSNGIMEGGEIKDPKALSETITELVRELGVHVVKASLPEEKMYLFKTTVPSTDQKEMRQNIEFKLEENVPLSRAESIFFFDPIPSISTNLATQTGTTEDLVSVSVAPRSLVLSYLETIKSAGVTVLSFEMQAKAIARALIPTGSRDTEMIVHIMDNKTGIYIVCGGVVCFTSTIPSGYKMALDEKSSQVVIDELKKSIRQVESYWVEHGNGTAVTGVVFSGQGATTNGLVSQCSASLSGTGDNKIRFDIGNVWQNAFSSDRYIPPISYDDSHGYVTAVGLALR